MKWISIKDSGQPIKDGIYLAWDGEMYDRMLYKNNKWRTHSPTIVGADATNRVTYYSTVDDPQKSIMDREDIKDHLELLEEKVGDMGFKGSNEYELFLREEIADFIIKGVTIKEK